MILHNNFFTIIFDTYPDLCKYLTFYLFTGESLTELTIAADVVTGELSPGIDVAVSLPPSLFERINVRASYSLVFARYNESTLFPINGGANMNSSKPRQMMIATDILATTVVEETFSDLDEDNVTIIFQLKIPDGKVCSYTALDLILKSVFASLMWCSENL